MRCKLLEQQCWVRSCKCDTDLESINEGLASIHVLPIVVIHHIKVFRRDGTRVRRAAPDDFGALLLQAVILAERSLVFALALQQHAQAYKKTCDVRHSS